MNIYEKIDTIFSGESDDRPVWVVEILDELKSIKKLLEKQELSSKNKEVDYPLYSNNTTYKTQTYFEFISYLRDTYKDCNNLNQDIVYKNQKLGITDGGLIYNKRTNRVLSTQDAKVIYKDLYYQSKSMLQSTVA